MSLRELAPVTPEEWGRFNSRTSIGHFGCIIFNGARVGHGHAQFSIKRGGRWITVLAHRFAYTRHFGPIPTGMFVCHSCDNPPCVNPAHLFLGTNRDNMQDAAAKGRTHRGPRSGAWNPWNRGVTHCRHGHPLSGDNLRIERSHGAHCKTCAGPGHRVCVTCKRAQQNRRTAAIRALRDGLEDK